MKGIKKYYSKLVKCALNYHDANGNGTLDLTKKENGKEYPIDDNYGSSLTRVCRVLIPQEQAIRDRKYGYICPWCDAALDRYKKCVEKVG